jgi:hypothetical protein
MSLSKFLIKFPILISLMIVRLSPILGFSFRFDYSERNMYEISSTTSNLFERLNQAGTPLL